MVTRKGSKVKVIVGSTVCTLKSKGLQAYLDLVKDAKTTTGHNGSFSFNMRVITTCIGNPITGIPIVRDQLLAMYPKAIIHNDAIFIGSGKDGAGVDFNNLYDLTDDIKEFCFS